MKHKSVRSKYRGQPAKWSEESVAKVNRCPSEGNSLLDPYGELSSDIESYFEQEGWLSRNGRKVEHSLDSENLQPLFAFLILILNPTA